MPVARVRLSDGRVAKFQVPEGTTPDQVVAYAQGMEKELGSEQPTDSPGFNAEAALDTVKDLPRYGMDAVRSVGTGAMDLVVGAGQLASKFMGDEQRERYSDYMGARETDYQAGRANQEAPDVGRFTGSVVAGGALSGGAAAPTLVGRMAQGAKVGGAIGLTSPVDPASDYLTAKAIQTGGGAAVGFLAPAAVEGVVRGIGAATNALAGKIKGLLGNTMTGQASAKSIERTLSGELERQGVKWAEIPQSYKDSLIAEVQKGLKAGGTIDDEAIRRLADFQRFKIEPTRGQVTRDPLQYAREQNVAKIEAGQPLAQRFGEQSRQLVGAVDDIRADTGARTADPYATGQRLISDLQARDAARSGAVDTAYTQARQLAGMESDVPLQPVAQRLGQVIEDFGDDRVPSAVMKRLQDFGLMGGTQTRVFNIREAEKLKTLIGNNIDPANKPQMAALTRLRDSVDEAVNSLGDDAGSQAAGAFREARGLAAQRFGTLDRTPGMAKAVRGDLEPEKFVETQIIRGSVQDTANLLRQLGPQGRQEVRGAVMDYLRSKAVSGAEDTARFSQGAYNRALKAIGDRRLELIFAGDRMGLEQIRALGRVGAYVQAPPVASGVNYSSSGTALFDLLEKGGRLPIAGLPIQLLTGRPAQMQAAAQAASAMRAAPVRPMPGLLNPQAVARMGATGGLLAPSVAASTIPLLQEQPTRRGLLSY